jgi:LCP family protein required for cell wall assembly
MSDEPDGTAAHSAAGGSSSPVPTKPPSGQPSRSKWLPLRHKVLTVSALGLALVAGCGSGYWMWADKQLDAIPRVEIGIDTPEQKDHHEEKYPLNILLLGADHGQVGQSVAEDLEDGKWTPGQHLSDTIMVLHIPADRESVQLVSIPRDTWVSIDGYPADDGHGKINAAFSYGGPELAYETVENLTGLKIDHVAIIDWVGFRDLTTALGGVRVYVPETFYDSSQRITWEKGWQSLEGDRALQYVRTRHDIPGSKQDDFGRIARQQNFMRAVMGKLLSSDTTHNPVRFTKVLASLSSYLTIDSTWDNDEIRSLAWSLRNLHTEDVDFFTAPFGSYATINGQSVVHLDMPQFRVLVRTIKNDRVGLYAKRYPDNQLAGVTEVN